MGVACARGAAVVTALLLVAGCGGGGSDEASAPKAGTLTDVSSVEQFASVFDGDAGTARLVVLFSPT